MKWHFILHNVWLIGMCAAQLTGGLVNDGLPHILFVIFAIIGAAGFLIMVGNLYVILLPAREKEIPS